MTESIILNGTEYLTRKGVEKEYFIKSCSLYNLVKLDKIKHMKHPSFGVCFKREWIDNYFENFKNKKR